MSQSKWGAGVSFFVGMIAQFAPIPEPWKKGITILAAIGLLVSVVGWCYASASRTPVGAKTPRKILTEIVDSGIRKSYQGSILMSQTGMERIEALIRASDDLRTERDTVWVCKQLAKSGTDPFEFYELKYGRGAFKGKRLKFLQDARIHARIKNDDGALNYLYSTWADENGLKETTGEPRARFAIIQAFNKWSRRFR